MARKTKEEAQRTRTHILDAAELLFCEQGISRTSLQQIAQAAHLTRGAIYWHFSDKLDLFQALLDRATMPVDDVFARAKAQKDMPNLQKIELIAAGMIQLIVSDQHIRNVLDIVTHKIELVGEFAVMRERYLNHLDRVTSTFAQLLLQASQNGELLITEQHAYDASHGMNALIDGIFHSWIHAPAAFDLETLVNYNVKVYLQGLKASV